mgnify:FL=1
MPQIKSSELAVDIAELEKKKAKGAFLPSLSMNAGLGTGHLSGTDYAFGSQVWNSFNESVGLTISIPIFSNRQYKTAYNKAKYAITTSQLELLNTQKQLLQTVEGIYLDATSSQTQYTSATERLSYVKESYNLIDEQFSLGMKNTLELLTEKNNYLTAQQEQLQAKYMALMSVSSVPFRSAIVMPLSMTRPSIWWNMGECVASTSSLRYTRPGAKIRIGGWPMASMARICMGLVCVRRRTSSSSVT